MELTYNKDLDPQYLTSAIRITAQGWKTANSFVRGKESRSICKPIAQCPEVLVQTHAIILIFTFLQSYNINYAQVA